LGLGLEVGVGSGVAVGVGLGFHHDDGASCARRVGERPVRGRWLGPDERRPQRRVRGGLVRVRVRVSLP